jgi:DNA repair exonuclease SbcCD ATPase subunit
MRENMGRVRSTKQKDIAPFTGLLKCPDCGYSLRRTSTYYTVKSTGERKPIYSYNCSIFASTGKTACSAHYISEKDLKQIVIEDIQRIAGEILQDENTSRKHFYALKAKSSETQLKTNRNTLQKINKRIADLDILIRKAFERSALEDIYSEYEQEYKTEKQELAQQAKELTEFIDKQSQTENDVETYIDLIKKYSDITELDRATAVELIDHITISASTVKPRVIEIYYNFVGIL